MPPRARKPAAPSEKGGARQGEISATEMAKRLSITPQALGMWAKRPNAPVRVDGRRVWYRNGAFQRWREQELVAQEVAKMMPSVTRGEALTRKAVADAVRSEIEVVKELQKVVYVDDVATAWGNATGIVVSRLRAIPSRIAHFGVELEAAVSAEVEAAIEELQQFDADVIPDEVDIEVAA